MCTAVWQATPERLTLLFNRDEQRTRPEAEGPARRKGHFLAPRDPQAQGTWIAVNAEGVALCLLNYHGSDAIAPVNSRARRYSRGLLVWELATAKNLAEVSARLPLMPLERCWPFLLLSFSMEGGVRGWQWNGRNVLPLPSPQPPLTTSSYEPDSVVPSRMAAWDRLTSHDIPDLEGYLLSREGVQGAYHVCMSRSDARTISQTRVEITPREVRMGYRPWWEKHQRFAPETWVGLTRNLGRISP